MKEADRAGRAHVFLSSVSAAQADQLRILKNAASSALPYPRTFHRSARWCTDLQPPGYDIDMARYLAKIDEAQAAAGPVTGANRVPYLQTDKIGHGDLQPRQERREREKVVDFSRAYARSSSGCLAEGGGLKDAAALSGKSIRRDPWGGGRYGADQRGCRPRR